MKFRHYPTEFHGGNFVLQRALRSGMDGLTLPIERS